MSSRDMNSSLNKKEIFINLSINYYNIFCRNLSKPAKKGKNIIYQNDNY
jgi:hypothetical protein